MNRITRIGHRRSVGAIAGLLGAGACALAVGVGGASASGRPESPTALAASTISLNESGSLHLTSHHGFHLNEQGSASGTIRGTIYIHLDVTSTNRVTAEVNIYPAAARSPATATANYRSEGGEATFSGTMSISRGTGTYAHAHASASASAARSSAPTTPTTVHVSGPLSY